MMKRLVLAMCGCAVVTTTFGCVQPVGCDFRDAPGGRQEDRCQERRNFQAVGGFAEFCKGLDGEVREGGCPTEGIVAGCDTGGDVIDWYYEPTTREEVESECEGEGTVIDAP